MDSNSPVVRISQRYLYRSDEARRERRAQNEVNWNAYRGKQDFSNKLAHQTKMVTPSFPMAIEQIVGTFERALTDSDTWMTADVIGVGSGLLPPSMIQGVTRFFTERLYQPGNAEETAYDIAALVGDAVKRGALEPTVVAKAYPVLVRRRDFRFREPKVSKSDDLVMSRPAEELGDVAGEPVETTVLRVAIEVIPWNDYFPDPSPAKRYVIHKTRRFLHELKANEDYDQDVVATLLGKAREDELRRDQARTRNEDTPGGDPYQIEVYEGWGDIIDDQTGDLLHENVFWAWTGTGEILRPPTPNPFKDGTSPFVEVSILPVHNSGEPKALADHAVEPWMATNELASLLVDGAFRAAWGIGQARTDIMESPEEIQGGVPQGYTAVLKPNTPLGAKFYERVDNGEAPQLSLDQLNRLESYVSESLATPDSRMGQINQRQVKATEAVLAEKGSGVLYDAFAARFESRFLEPLFQKVWKIVIQWADDFLEDELVQVLGPRMSLILDSMPKEERWALLHKAKFRIRGVRGMADREKRFNRTMTILNILGANPMFADAFGKKFSYEKLMTEAVIASGIDPATIELDDEELAAQVGGEPPAVPGAVAEDAPPPEETAGMIANGQLDASLMGSGASQPNVNNTLADQRGAESALAPNNPAAG
jgi:hypothetical protein